MMRLMKRDVGIRVIWHGFDGKLYKAVIVKVRNRVAVLHYPVPGMDELCTAYVGPEDHIRIDRA